MDRISVVLCLIVLAGAPPVAWAQHLHLNAGAFGTSQNDPLYFVNGACCFATNTGYALNLSLTNAGTYAGYYQGGGITMTSLPQTENNGGPAFGAAAIGSYIVVELVSVSGPAGGVFSVWEVGATSPTHTLPSGATGGTTRWNLSEGNGAPGSDPYGHIHGRVFTATQPGMYTVGFRLYDASTNGVSGGPIHSPSDVFYMNFRAVGEFRITSIAIDGNDVRVEWTTTGPGTTNALQVSGGDAAGNYVTNNFVNLFVVTNTTEAVTNYLDVGGATNRPARYYRVRRVP